MTTDWRDIRWQAHSDILSYMALMRPETKFGPQHYLFRNVVNDLKARRKRFVCLSCPPRHSKSYTFSTALPAWWLGNSPKDQVIATSYASALAQSFGSSLRADMSSELYGRIFSSDAQPSGTSSSGTDFQTNAGGKYKATGVGGSLTGFGGDLIVVDDPVKNAETADSPRYKEMLEKFFGETLYTRLMPNGVIVVMMTRWREDDLIGYILRNFDEWEYINVPAVVEEQDLGSVGALGRGVDEALWPDFFTAKDLSRTRKVLGEAAFQALYQGRPVSAKGGTLSASDLLWADELPKQLDDLSLDLPLYSFWSWDTALTATQKSDWTVGQYWTLYRSGKLHMTDYVRMRGNFTQVQQAIVDSYDGSDADFVVIEHSHMGLNLEDQLRQDRPDIGVRLHKPKGDKLARLQQCLPMWRDGRLWLKQLNDRSDFADCIDELTKAGLTAHDDFMDALTQAVLFSKSYGHTGAKASSTRVTRQLAETGARIATVTVKRKRKQWA